MGFSLVSWGPSMGFLKHGGYGLHLGQHNGVEGRYFLDVYFFCT